MEALTALAPPRKERDACVCVRAASCPPYSAQDVWGFVVPYLYTATRPLINEFAHAFIGAIFDPSSDSCFMTSP